MSCSNHPKPCRSRAENGRKCDHPGWNGRDSQLKDQTCARDAAGQAQAQAEETQKALDDFVPEIGQGQRDDRSLPKTVEVCVLRLISQRRSPTWSLPVESTSL